MSAIIDWLNSPAVHAFGAATTWAEILGFATGALCVWLVARQHILTWPTGIANILLWILLFASAGLYADSALQGTYIALGLWGWWQWLHGGTNRTARVVTGTSGREWAGLGPPECWAPSRSPGSSTGRRRRPCRSGTRSPQRSRS